MYVKCHVGCNISYGGIVVGLEVVEQLVDMSLRLFSSQTLFGRDTAKGNEGGEVDCPGVIHNGSDNLLYAFDFVGR